MWQPRRRDERADSGEQIKRLEHEGDCAVAPGLLQGVSELAICRFFEAQPELFLEREPFAGRRRHRFAQALCHRAELQFEQFLDRLFVDHVSPSLS